LVGGWVLRGDGIVADVFKITVSYDIFWWWEDLSAYKFYKDPDYKHC
jgi:hypothetical protein